MFGRLVRAVKAYRLLGRCEDAFLDGLEKPMSKTKIGALMAGLGLLLTLGATVLTGDVSIADALPQALAIIGGVLAVFGGRDALKKIGNGQ